MVVRFLNCSAMHFAVIAFLMTGTSLHAQNKLVSFTRDVRPILSQHCFACHGPDEAKRKADLRLDIADGIRSVVDKEKPQQSEFVIRIRSIDPDAIMPPPDFHKPLSNKQKSILKAWIESGAEFQSHWAFSPPSMPRDAAPTIDYYLNRSIKHAKLTANKRADRRTLLRRICLDLTGLPPTRIQINDFLQDGSSNAIERLIDQLQSTPQYAEHMARYWLDLVRYGDTHGLHLDNYREMWPYRDWVIQAFRDNMPFNQFITEQLAGDLFADASESQLIASGFNRLNVTTNEGGSIYDEVFARNVIDRTDAFGTIFLGLTAGCAVCHDHKFDPITQRDYYSLAAFFNSLDGRAMDENIKNPAPVIPVLSDEQKSRLAEYDQAMRDLETRMSGPIESVDAAQAAWESSLLGESTPKSVVLRPIKATSESKIEMSIRDDGSVELVGDAAAKDTTTIIADLPAGGAWQTLRLEALVDSPDKRVGASNNGNALLTEITVETSDPDVPSEWNPVPINAAVADIEQSDGPFEVRLAIDEKLSPREGWGVGGHQQTGPRNAWFVVPALMSDALYPNTKIRIQLKYQSIFKAHQFRRIRFSISDAPPTVSEDQLIQFSPIHSVGPFPVESPAPGYRRAFGSRGKPFNASEEFEYEDKSYAWRVREDIVPVEVAPLDTIDDRATVTLLHQSIQAPRKQRVTLLFGSDDGHAIYLNGKRIAFVQGAREHKPLEYEYDLELKKGDNRFYIQTVNHGGSNALSFAWRSPAIKNPPELLQLVQKQVDERSDTDRASLQKYYRAVACLHPDWLALVDHRKGIDAGRKKVVASAPTTLVWKETEKPRDSHILIRGQYDQRGEVVPRATPAFLGPLRTGAPKDRLGLAQWLCSESNPLTARVAVNRFWQQIFGAGLVKTSEDFGNQGEVASHPELLDFLAVDLRENGWDVNRLIKMMLLSDAYQRSSRATEQLLAIDPENRLLARGPRHRLDAEVLRDQALALSGLLQQKVGGESVKPPQPDGLWQAVGYSRSNTAKFTADTDPSKIYRRSLYIFWKRTSPPPMMSTVDAPSRESCTARRERTNTPLQALLMLNEVQYVQAAKHLAKRVLENSDLTTDKQRIDWLFETVTIRRPTEQESTELLTLLSDLTSEYSSDQAAAESIAGERSAEKAAWVVISNTLLNLDEVISK